MSDAEGGPMTPEAVWTSLREGNERFVAGAPMHPSQGIDDRARLRWGQNPRTVLFGCADSRVAAEIIFDQGLGDMFVVRTAGHITDSAVLGSLEYGVKVLGCTLIVVLGHDRCGAIHATLDALDRGLVPTGFIRDVVERVTPSILNARREGYTNIDDMEAQHVLQTGQLLLERSRVIAEAVDAGTLAVVGVTYTLLDGGITLRGVLGDIGEKPAGVGPDPSTEYE